MGRNISQSMNSSIDESRQQKQQHASSFHQNITDAATAFGVRIPDEYVCPITMEVMTAPVQSIYGHNFEKDAIRIWLQDHSCCPLTRRPMRMHDLTSNKLLRADIGQWIFYNCLQMRIRCQNSNMKKDENKHHSHDMDQEHSSAANTNTYHHHHQFPSHGSIDQLVTV
jgi:U-box domain